MRNLLKFRATTTKTKKVTYYHPPTNIPGIVWVRSRTSSTSCCVACRPISSSSSSSSSSISFRRFFAVSRALKALPVFLFFFKNAPRQKCRRMALVAHCTASRPPRKVRCCTPLRTTASKCSRSRTPSPVPQPCECARYKKRRKQKAWGWAGL